MDRLSPGAGPRLGELALGALISLALIAVMSALALVV